jgi:hopene-associated glycosyltransferase HpnB
VTIIGLLTVAIWVYLLTRHGNFWRDRVEAASPVPSVWPEVVAVIPARDEADSIADTITSLMAQRYPGRLSIVLVDDQSSDGTADLARRAAVQAGSEDRLTVLAGAPLPQGWVGKMWAVNQGLARAAETAPEAAFVLLTDADIAHAPDNVAELVAKAEDRRLNLASLMVELNCFTWAERAVIPAFVYFFRMLYPFEQVADPAHRIAAAAGGCMLVRRSALDAIGGVTSIRDQLIDDCALAAALKPKGPIWLGLADGTRSLRVYPLLSDIRAMIARSAYTQLRYSPLMLAGTVLGLSLIFVAPPWLALFGHGWAALFGWIAWIMMAISFVPMLKRYRRSLLWAPTLPLVALFYLGATIQSAWAHWQGAGGAWKGRIQGGHA